MAAQRKTTQTKKTTSRAKSKSTSKRTPRKTTAKSPVTKSATVVPESNNKVRIIGLLILLFVVAYFLRGFFVASLVNGTPIYRSSIVKQLESLGGAQVKEEMIQQILVRQALQDRGIGVVTEEELQDEISIIDAQIAEQGSSLDEELARQGVTREQFESSLRYQLGVKKLIEAEPVEITDDQVEDYYEVNKEVYEGEELTDELKEEIKTYLEQIELSNRATLIIQELRSEATVTNFVDY